VRSRLSTSALSGGIAPEDGDARVIALSPAVMVREISEDGRSAV
jgi:hypothetical protein